jgi:hypothetical protein
MCASALERAGAAEAVQLRLGEELAAARARAAEMATTMGQFALRHDAMHRAEATLAQLAAEQHAEPASSAMSAPRAAAWAAPAETQPEAAVAAPADDAAHQPATSNGLTTSASAAALTASLSALAELTPSKAYAPRRAGPLPVADAAPLDSLFSPAELSSEEDDASDDEAIVGPDVVQSAAAALAAAEQEAAQLTAHEHSVRKEEEQAAANSAYSTELAQRARAAVAAAAAALGGAPDAETDPKLHRNLVAAKARAEQEAARAEENARVAAAAAHACAAAAAVAADAAAVARATATAKSFTAARVAAAERRQADFRAKLSAVKTQSATLEKQLRAERVACSRASNEASALMAVLSASGKAELVADAAARAEELERAASDDGPDFPATPPAQPQRADALIQFAAEERDRLAGRLAMARSQREAAAALVVDLTALLDLLKSDATAGRGQPRPPVAPKPAAGAGLFSRMKR